MKEDKNNSNGKIEVKIGEREERREYRKRERVVK
jgi:hypothetical protein